MVPRRATTLWHWATHELAHGDPAAGETMCQEARDTFERLNLPLAIAQMEAQASER